MFFTVFFVERCKKNNGSISKTIITHKDNTNIEIDSIKSHSKTIQIDSIRTHSQKTTWDSAVFIEWLRPQILKEYKIRSVYSPLKKHSAASNKLDKDSTTSSASLCDSLNTYLDTTKQDDITIYSEISVRGIMLKHEVSGKINKKVIIKTITNNDSLNIKETITNNNSLEVDKKTTKTDSTFIKNSSTSEKNYPFRKKAKIAIVSFFSGATAIIAAEIYYYLKP